MITTTLKELSDKWFHPNRKEQEEMMSRLTNYKELSSVAVQLGDMAAYRNLQIEMNQIFMKYMVTVFFDGLRFLLPHLIILAVLSTYVDSIKLSFIIPGLGGEIGILVWYPVVAILAHVTHKRLKKRLSKITAERFSSNSDI